RTVPAAGAGVRRAGQIDQPGPGPHDPRRAHSGAATTDDDALGPVPVVGTRPGLHAVRADRAVPVVTATAAVNPAVRDAARGDRAPATHLRQWCRRQRIGGRDLRRWRA